MICGNDDMIKLLTKEQASYYRNINKPLVY